MHAEINLTEIAIVVVAALIGGILLARFRQPSILGYILTGVFLGPSGLSLISSRDPVTALAELGVLLLLFVVGMELNLRIFKKVWVVATLCTVLQIICCATITFLLSYLFKWSLGLALLLGFVVAISSTAVVFKMLESIGELKSETGQLVVGILIAQDLAIIPMILILRGYGQGHSFFSSSLLLKVSMAIGLTAFLIKYLSDKKLVRFPLLTFLAEQKDLVPLAGLTICFAAAALSGLMGLSAPYGAFLAGLALGNTQESESYLETTKPIQTILMMLFFLSIGLLLDIEFIWNNVVSVLTLVFIVTIGKTALNVGILRLLRVSWSQAFLVGSLVAQLGEFAFLMASVSRKSGIIDHDGERLIIALTVLSLAFSPIWHSISKRLGYLTSLNNLSLQSILTILYSHELSGLKKILKVIKNRCQPPPPNKENLLISHEEKE